MIAPKKTPGIFVAPIEHLEIDAAVNYEFRINRVTLISTDKLQARRRRFGFPSRLSEMKAQPHGIVFKQFFDRAPTIAIVRITGISKDIERQAVTIIRDELAILTASQLGYAKRSSAGAPAIVGEKPVTKQSLLWMNTQDGTLTQPNRVYGPLISLRLDSTWLGFQRKVFFLKLLQLLKDKQQLKREWRNDLRRATILVGLSQAANSVSEAFLWNMIALELLLTRRGDRVRDELPSRAEAFLGWSSDWTQDKFKPRIQTAYLKRCMLVHQGDREAPTCEDLFFTDDLLLCLLTNLVSHANLFRSKEDIINFSLRVEAEQRLNVKARVRPKSLRFLRRTYDPKDYDIY